MANETRPKRMAISPLSTKSCMPTAVEESARTLPTSRAISRGSFRYCKISVMTTPVTMTCASPRPKTYLLRTCNRCRGILRPIVNNRKTTPNSPRMRVPSIVVINPRLCGPIRSPAKRYPRIGLTRRR